MVIHNIILILLLSLFSGSVYADDVVVISNSKNQTQALDSSQIQDIYMGRKHAFPDGKMALPIDQALLRSGFYEKLTTRPIAQINAYWARIMFSGQASPPMILPDDQAVIKVVTENAGAMGYINKSSLSKNVHVLLILK
jgi:ABC-type phosphate transport system substrate-binding protein